ncbi:hypothetical protein [Candidatus Uabimicrobium amorphum]|uniref:Uncharacterized protein n=1 Tax=Uabimicrobium amorphum TaxID=2596890 RepID=A0A5S9IPT4_UABAM|nr:hypothetical protein [Candidatus Uabimicrobium amorphum]BBM84465.1 hypothetical protein UABAM_02826 [Candidatus Uabimicrobium amorphum]
MTLEELHHRLGKFDGYAISMFDILCHRTENLEDCICNAISVIEEDGDLYSMEIWSVEKLTVKGVAPCGETIIDHMWDRFQFEEFMEDVSAKQKALLGEMIAETISNWIKKENINFDYYTGIKKETVSYTELQSMARETERKETA